LNRYEIRKKEVRIAAKKYNEEKLDILNAGKAVFFLKTHLWER